jgi:hypothetical protein
MATMVPPKTTVWSLVQLQGITDIKQAVREAIQETLVNDCKGKGET